MDSKDQLQKILEWLKQMSRTMATVSTVRDLEDRLVSKLDLSERKMHNRIDALDERIDGLSEAIQTMLKAMRGIRIEQFNDRSRFAKELQKIKQEIRELMH